MPFILLLFLTSKEALFVLLHFNFQEHAAKVASTISHKQYGKLSKTSGLQVEYTSNDELKILYRPTDGSGVLTRVGDLDILLSYFENTWLDGRQFSPVKRSVLN